MNLFQESIDITEITLFRVGAEPVDRLNQLMSEPDILVQYSLLQQFIKESVILDALPFSSLVFYKEVLKFLEKPVGSFRKSERKIARKLIQYAIRATYKNSPFHTLGQIGFLSQHKPISIKNKQLFTFNDHIEQALHENFIQKGYIAVTLNPTIRYEKSTDIFTFFMDQSGQEALMELESNAFLKELFQHKILSQYKFIAPSAIAQEYAPYDKIEQKDIVEYLLSLVDIGFLIVVREHSAIDVFQIQDANYQALLHLQIDIETKIGTQVIRPEEYVYVDSILHIKKSNIDIDLHYSYLEKIASLISMATPFWYQTNSMGIFQDFIPNIPKNKGVPLLDFYAWYCEQETTLKEKSAFLNCNVEDLFQVINILDDKIFIELKSGITQPLNPTAYSVFSSISIEQNPKKQLHVVNAVGLGYGKFFGRFLHFINEKVTFQPNFEHLLVESADSTLFTANNKNRFFPNRITTPSNFKGEVGEILISDIELIRKDDNLSLVYTVTNQVIETLDLGLMHPNGRTALYRLLQYFERPRISFSNIQQLLQKNYEKSVISGLTYCPRIMLDMNIVLKRQQWIIDSRLIDLKTLPEIVGYYGIPNKVFVVFSPRKYQENGFEIHDFHKPMYIQFDAPICLELWKSGIQKTNSFIIIEESLPSNDSFPEINGENKAIELVNEIWA